MHSIDQAMAVIYQKLELNINEPMRMLLAQKKIYLLQELGLSLGYSFSWYLDGVHTADLTYYLRENRGYLSTYPIDTLEVRQNALDVIEKLYCINASRLTKKLRGMPEYLYYIIMTSIPYLGNGYRGGSLKNVHDQLNLLDFNFTDNQFDAICDVLELVELPVKFDLSDRGFLNKRYGDVDKIGSFVI